MAFCPKCQQSIEGQAGFCPYDGTVLTPTETPTAADSTPPAAADADADADADVGPEPSQPPQLEEQASDLNVGDESAVLAVSAMGSSAEAVKLFADTKATAHRGLVGKTLDGRYRIESVLGEGGMGIVFLARHVVIEKLVAVKILKKDASKNENVATRFVREAKAASRIGHPNIIDVTDFGTTENGITYSVMEYVEGATLAEVIRLDCPMPVERVLRIVAQMARALEAAHNKGVVHRDLKPDNVFLVNRDGRSDFVKIVDFGIARLLPIPGNSNIARLTRAGTVFGTPEYMAPEQASGRTDTDHRVDIYALGTIMYELLSGEVPHKGDSTVRTLAMQMLDSIPPLSSLEVTRKIDPAVNAIVMRALEKKREARFQNMGEMLRDVMVLSDEHDTVNVTATRNFPRSASSSPVNTDDRPTEVDEAPSGSSPTGSLGVLLAKAGSVQSEDERDTVGLSTNDVIRGLEATSSQVAAGRSMTTSPTEIYQALPKGEPAFVRRRRRPSIDDLYDDPDADLTDPKRTVWRWLLPLTLAIGAIGVLVVVIVAMANKTDDSATTAISIDAADVRDAGSAALTAGGRSDAASVAVGSDDGGSADAGSLATNGNSKTGNGNGQANTKVRDPRGLLVGKPVKLGELVDLEILTRPKGGAIWTGGDYAGPDGIVIRRPSGTKGKFRCTKRGFKANTINVSFGPQPKTIICQMRQTSKCVPGLKNPYATCD